MDLPIAERSADEGEGWPTACSSEVVPRTASEVPAVAFPRGSGPVYAGLGTGGVVHYTEDNRQREGWYYHKTLWAIAPEYEGAVTIVGRQLDGDNGLRFNPGAGFPGRSLDRLVLPREKAPDWRFGPSDTLIRAPGCYALRVEGETFEYFITFRAAP
jgi:hypothetical protein